MTDVPVRAVKKALDLLDLLLLETSWESGASLSALAESMGIPVNTTHNLLKTMTHCGYIARTPEGHYTVGVKVRHLGQMQRMKSDVTAHAILPVLHTLNAHVQEGLNFTFLLHGRRVLLAHVNPRQAVRVDQDLIERLSIYALATGRVLLAEGDKSEVETAIERYGMPGEQWDDIQDAATLSDALAQVRAAGCAVVEHPEYGTIAYAVSVPVPHFVTCALGCYVPRFRCDDTRGEEILARLRESATRLTEVLTLEGVPTWTT